MFVAGGEFRGWSEFEKHGWEPQRNHRPVRRSSFIAQFEEHDLSIFVGSSLAPALARSSSAGYFEWRRQSL